MAGFSDMLAGSAAQALGAAGPALGLQALSGGLSGLISLPFQAKAQKRQYKYQTQLMQQQHGYELENLAQQDLYQRNLVRDSNSLLKQSLQRAGYSTADPNGTGVTPAQVSGPSTSASGSAGSFPVSPSMSPVSYSDLIQAQNVASQTRLNTIEAKYRAKLLEGQIGKYNMEIDVMKEQLPEQVNLLKQEFKNKQAELRLTDQQVAELDAKIDQLKASTDGIKIDNKYKEDLNDATVKKLQNEANLLAKEGKIKAVQALLADAGILVGADWFTQLAAISARGGDEQIINSLVNLVERVSGALPSVAGKLFGSVSDTILKSGKNILDKLKGVFE